MDRRLVIIAVAAVCAVAALAVQLHVTDDKGPKDFIIIHTGDTHGYIGDDDSSLGLSTAKVLAEQYEQKGYPVFTVDVGDFMGGNNMLYATDGGYATIPMGSVGYDLVTLGNHEFDYTVDIMNEQLGLLGATVICSNLLHSNGEPAFKQYEILEKKGVRIGFFALLTPDVNYYSKDMMGDMKAEDPLECAREMVKILRDRGVDAVVLMSHLGIGDGFNPRSDYICSQVDGIDLCINGHSHTPMEHGKFIDPAKSLIPSNTFIADAGYQSQYVGIASRISGEYDGILYKGEPLHDAGVDAKVRTAHELAMSRGNERISYTELDLTGYRETGSGKENGLSKLCANYLMTLQEVDFTMMPVDRVDATIAKGDITRFETLDAILNPGRTVSFEITGQELLDFVKKNFREGGPNMMEFSDNIRVYTDQSGTEVVGITLNGEDLDLSKTYISLTNSYAFSRIIKLPWDRLIETIVNQRAFLLTLFEEYNPITQEHVGGDRYAKS